MATIRPNDNAPQEDFKIILPGDTLDLSPGGTYETDDRTVLADAESHPWLSVEYPEVDDASFTRESKSVPYKDDVLAAVNSRAFDYDEIRKVETEKAAGVAHPLAVNAGLDQGEAQTVGEGDHAVAVTLAADEAADDNDEKPARKSRRTAQKED